MAFLDYTGLTSFWNKVKDILSGKQNTLTAGEGVSLDNDTVAVQEPVKEVTQAQYDALTEEQKNTGLYVVTDATINLNDHGDIYSTDETRIGTWIDGKPLYRRAFQFLFSSTGVQRVSITETPDVDMIISVHGVLNGYADSKNGYMLPYLYSGGISLTWEASSKYFLVISESGASAF